MRIIGNKREIEILMALSRSDAWAYPAIAEMLQHCSLEIADNMPLSTNKFSIALPDGIREATLDEVANIVGNNDVFESILAESPVMDESEPVIEESPVEEIPQSDGTVEATISRLSSIGCVYEDGIATTEQGQKFEVFIQKGSETVEAFLTNLASAIHQKESSALLVARDCEDKSRLIRIARTVLGAQTEDGKTWFATSPDMPWGKGLVFSSLHLAPARRLNDDIEKAAALHYAARKQIACVGDWINEIKNTIVKEVEEAVSTLGELSPEEQLSAAKTVVGKVADGNFNRADLSCAITVRKLVDLNVFNPFEQHKVSLTDKGVLLAKAWGFSTVARRPTSVDNIVMLVRSLLNGQFFERDVMIQDDENVIRIRCARANEARDIVEADGCNHLFYAIHDSAEPSEFEFLASGLCGKVAAWRVSELRENTGLPRMKFHES